MDIFVSDLGMSLNTCIWIFFTWGCGCQGMLEWCETCGFDLNFPAGTRDDGLLKYFLEGIDALLVT